MRFDDDGLAVEDLVAAVRCAAAQACFADSGEGPGLRITGVELTLHAVARGGPGSRLDFRIPVLGKPVSFGTRVTRHETHQIRIALEPIPGGRDGDAGAAEETLVEAIEAVRALVTRGIGSAAAFRHRGSEVELTFAVTDTGAIALLGTADLTDEITHTLRLTLGPS